MLVSACTYTITSLLNLPFQNICCCYLLLTFTIIHQGFGGTCLQSEASGRTLEVKPCVWRRAVSTWTTMACSKPGLAGTDIMIDMILNSDKVWHLEVWPVHVGMGRTVSPHQLASVFVRLRYKRGFDALERQLPFTYSRAPAQSNDIASGFNSLSSRFRLQLEQLYLQLYEELAQPP